MGLITDSLVISLLLAGGLLGWVAVRRIRLRRGGGVAVLVRRPAGRGWRHGLGRYRGDEFVWYPLAGLRPGPELVLSRTTLAIAERRPLSALDGSPMPRAVTALRFTGGPHGMEFAMAADVLTGFQSWLEAAPPGRTTGYRQAS